MTQAGVLEKAGVQVLGGPEEAMPSSADPERELYHLAREVMATARAQVARDFAQAFPEEAGDATPSVSTGVPEITLPRIEGNMPPECETLCDAFLRNHAQLGWAPEASWELGAVHGIGAWLSLASSAGPIVLEDRLLALTVLNPRAYYPLHRHTPEEIYITIAGGFWLHHPGRDAVWVGPGDTVFNGSNQPHALTGGEASTLMIACWRDGSFEPSVILE
ncbi:MAG: dimethylsulfonioproprionate lyase family protein [Pseudomonadota bacterium]